MKHEAKGQAPGTDSSDNVAGQALGTSASNVAGQALDVAGRALALGCGWWLVKHWAHLHEQIVEIELLRTQF